MDSSGNANAVGPNYNQNIKKLKRGDRRGTATTDDTAAQKKGALKAAGAPCAGIIAVEMSATR